MRLENLTVNVIDNVHTVVIRLNGKRCVKEASFYQILPVLPMALLALLKITKSKITKYDAFTIINRGSCSIEHLLDITVKL